MKSNLPLHITYIGLLDHHKISFVSRDITFITVNSSTIMHRSIGTHIRWKNCYRLTMYVNKSGAYGVLNGKEGFIVSLYFTQ